MELDRAGAAFTVLDSARQDCKVTFLNDSVFQCTLGGEPNHFFRVHLGHTWDSEDTPAEVEVTSHHIVRCKGDYISFRAVFRDDFGRVAGLSRRDDSLGIKLIGKLDSRVGDSITGRVDVV